MFRSNQVSVFQCFFILLVLFEIAQLLKYQSQLYMTCHLTTSGSIVAHLP